MYMQTGSMISFYQYLQGDPVQANTGKMDQKNGEVRSVAENLSKMAQALQQVVSSFKLK
jgi:hypothetical protein